MIDREKLARIRQLRSESDRLLAVLDFYGWLEEHGTSWDEIKGVRPLDNTNLSRSEFKRSCRKTGKSDLWDKYNHALFVQSPTLTNRWIKVRDDYDGPGTPERRPCAYQGKFIDIMLNNGERLVLPWPPFPVDVVYNRKRHEVKQ